MEHFSTKIIKDRDRKEQAELYKIKEVKYLVFVDFPAFRLNRHGYETKPLKLLKDNFFENEDGRWVPLNLYTEVICGSNSKIQQELAWLNITYEETLKEMETIKNKMNKLLNNFKSLIKLQKEI